MKLYHNTANFTIHLITNKFFTTLLHVSNCAFKIHLVHINFLLFFETISQFLKLSDAICVLFVPLNFKGPRRQILKHHLQRDKPAVLMFV